MASFLRGGVRRVIAKGCWNRDRHEVAAGGAESWFREVARFDAFNNRLNICRGLELSGEVESYPPRFSLLTVDFCSFDLGLQGLGLRLGMTLRDSADDVLEPGRIPVMRIDS
jgi:hypothetical protein